MKTRRCHLLSIILFAPVAFIVLLNTTGCLSTNPNYHSSISSSSQINSTSPAFTLTAPNPGDINKLVSVSFSTGPSLSVSLFSIIVNSNSTPLICSSATWEQSGTILLVKFNNDKVSIRVQITQTSGLLDLQITSDSRQLSAISQSEWNPSLQLKSIPVPYYTSTVYYSALLSMFLNSWWDWRTTHASSFAGMQQLYYPKTDGTLNSLSEDLHVSIASSVDAVFPATGNPSSPYLSSVAGRTVLDIWDAGFADIQSGLEALADYGLSHCVSIIHNWQFQGYDNGLPQHYPANPNLGGNEQLVSAMHSSPEDCLMALHENYVDYYPDYPQFDPSAIALNSDGSRMLSYFNATLGVQSYSVRHNRMIPNAELQSPYIHDLYGTTAAYLDGHSAAPLNAHGDMNSAVPGAGMMTDWMTSNENLFAYERSAHQGPVFGEGLNHWYYSGFLDGVEAQLGAGTVEQNSDTSVPLFVDFDLLVIHPLQVNHGMGYYNRWTSTKTNALSTLQQDAYRMQEIAFGHAPFLGVDAWDSIPRALTENGLVGPVAQRYGVSSVSSIQYLVNGVWSTPSQAAIAGNFSTPKIIYSNGLTVVANSSPSSVLWDGITIPQYGWVAVGNDINAFSAYCKNTTIWCDYAETPTSVFANARNQIDLGNSFGFSEPYVENFSSNSAHQFFLSIRWTSQIPLSPSENYRVFIHFVNDSLVTTSNEGTIFQAGYYPELPVSQWKPGQIIHDGPHMIIVPGNVPDGSYSVRIGLVNDKTGSRMLLSGKNDGTNRFILGYLMISGNGAKISFQIASAPSDDPRLNTNGQVLDFNSVKTDGMVLIDQHQGHWRLRPFPRTRAFTVLLNSVKFPMPEIVLPDDATMPAIVPSASENGYWQLPLTGAKSYSWPVQ